MYMYTERERERDIHHNIYIYREREIYHVPITHDMYYVC